MCRQQLKSTAAGLGERVTAQPTLSQASVYDVIRMDRQAVEALGFRVLVMRVWPRGVSWEHVDLWLPDAGPSLSLLQAYQGGEIDWDTFAERYRREQLFAWRHAGYYKVGKGKAGLHTSTLAPLQHLRALRKLHPVVTVMCHERPPDPCHRHVLVGIAGEVLVGDHVVPADVAGGGVVVSRDDEGYILVRQGEGAGAPEVRYHVSEVTLR
jgi:uncharacterized protein YeaO (DUF488 family)